MKTTNAIFNAIKFSTTGPNFLSGDWVINNEVGSNIWSYSGNVLTAQNNSNPGSKIYHPIEELIIGNDYNVSFDVDFFEQDNSAPVLNFALGDSENTSIRESFTDVRGGGSTKSFAGILTCYSEKLEFLNNRYETGVPTFSGMVYNISITPNF